jgi:hypothetical protein
VTLAWLADSFRLLGQGLSFCFLRAPKSGTPISGFASFSLLAALFAALITATSYFKAGDDSFFFETGYGEIALLLLAILLASALAAGLIQRKALWLSLASLALVCIGTWTMLLYLWTYDSNTYEVPRSVAARVVFGILLLCLFRIYWHLMQPRKAWRVTLAALFTLSLCFKPWQMHLYQPIYMSTDFSEEYAEDEPLWNYDAEQVFSAQADILQKQLARISNGQPGKIDLYGIGVAGDGSETVFRNEVEYLGRLLPLRLNAQYLPLINSEKGNPDIAIASAANLKSVVQAFSKKMDPEQDILLLYLTSHGSKSHEFVLGLGNLPMTQITPERLNRVLNESGIKHQVVIVSACYSGGYIEPLKSDNRLVITAARKDRTSFGCGADSEITWFGNAFWAMAMNKTVDFESGFVAANKTISGWERKDGQTASEPQISVGKKIHEQLGMWYAQFPKDLPTVAFKPAALPVEPRDLPGAADKSQHH